MSPLRSRPPNLSEEPVAIFTDQEPDSETERPRRSCSVATPPFGPPRAPSTKQRWLRGSARKSSDP